jgi:hypothetical protein
VPPEKYRESVQLLRQSKELYALAQHVSLSTRHPVDGAALARKSVYLLIASLLRLEGQRPKSFADCRGGLEDLPRRAEVLGSIDDDLDFLDELLGSFEPLGAAPEGQAARYEALLKRLPQAHKRAWRLLHQRMAAAGSNPRISRAIIALALVGALALGFWVALSGGTPPPAGQDDPPVAPESRAASAPSASAAPSVPVDPKACFHGAYFGDRNFQKSVGTRLDCQLDFGWESAAQVGIEGLSGDGFSVRWEGVLAVPESGQYSFHLVSDDGSRLFLDDELIIDNWGEHGSAEKSSEPLMLVPSKLHRLRVEFFDAGGLAELRLLWSSPTIERQPVPGQHVWRRAEDVPDPIKAGAVEPQEVLADRSKCFRASYFKGTDFGELVHSRRDCRIDFVWGTEPVEGVEGLPADGYSIRWEGTLQVPETADYEFILGSDDGSRLFIDDRQVVGEWSDRGYSDLYSDPIKLEAGKDYGIRVEYFERDGAAQVRLQWRSNKMARAPLSGRYVKPAAAPSK